MLLTKVDFKLLLYVNLIELFPVVFNTGVQSFKQKYIVITNKFFTCIYRIFIIIW